MGTNKYMSLTKEDLLDKIREFYEENGKVPHSKEIKNPTSIVYYDRFGTNKWNEILILAGLSPVHENGYSKEVLIEKLISYCDKLGKIPTRDDFKTYGFSPGHGLYASYFGSYELALEVAGVKEYISWNEKSKNSEKMIIELGEKLQRFPTVAEYESQCKDRNALERRKMEKFYGKKYNDICKQLLPDFRPNAVFNEYTCEMIIQDILDCIKKSLPIVPTFDEYCELSNNPYSQNTIKKFCEKTYIEIINELGYKSRGTTTRQKTKEEMINDFIKLYKELGRIPVTEEINGCEYCVSSPTYSVHFGGIEDICIACDIEYVANENNGFGFIVKDKNGDYCKSYAESVFTNYFIDNGIKYEKEYNYNKIPNFDEKDRRSLDWMIEYNGKVFYVEYFGCYTNTKNTSMNKGYVQKANKKVKDFKEKGLFDSCIFIYPKEYTTKTPKEIFKPYFERE